MLKRLSPFWAGLILILLVSALFGLLSYRFSLPFIDTDDEANYYLAGLEWRGQFDNQGYYDGVPPGYITVHSVLQPILEAFNINGIAPTIEALRLLAVLLNLATITCIVLAARLAGGNVAGLVAGGVWAVAPLVQDNAIYALPDPPVYFFTALALWLAAKALVLAGVSPRLWRDPALWSVAAGLLAVLFKYPALPALVPGLLAALVIALRGEKHGWRTLAAQVALIGAVGLWLVFVYGVDFNNLQREGAVVQQQGLSNLLNPARLANNLYYAVYPINAVAFTIVILLGAGAYWLARRQKIASIRLDVLLLMLPLLIGIPALAATFNLVEPTKIRYVLPATTAACIIFGAGVAQIAHLIPARLGAYRPALVALPLLALVWLPQLNHDWALMQERRLSDRRVALRQWFDTNLEPGSIIVDRDNHKTFNPIWGGIPHRYWVDWLETSDIREHSLIEWRENIGAQYAAIPRGWVEDMNETSDGRAYLAQLLHLRDFYAPPRQRGPEVSFYRLWRMESELDARFGEVIHLTGYDGGVERAKPGDTLMLRFYWKTTAAPVDNYSLFIHLVPLDEYEVLAQVDGAPAVSERPSITWDDASETHISPPFALALPGDLPPGEYRIMVGLYNFTSGERLLVEPPGVASGDALELLRLQIDK